MKYKATAITAGIALLVSAGVVYAANNYDSAKFLTKQA